MATIPSGRVETIAKHPALEDLFRYPLMSALTDRRTRRLARGASLDAGEIGHQSTNEPLPLSPLEEALFIIAITGITGTTTHDGPLRKPTGKPELGTPFLNILTRAASSPDNAQATHFFMINDDGQFLLRAPKGQAALDLVKDLPAKWEDWREEHWLHAAEQAKVRVGDRRIEYPREWPYYLGWNAQMSNVPGTTIFFPVVDCTWQYINALLIVTSEPDGKRPVLVDDWRQWKPQGLVERAVKLGGALRMTEAIPFHIIGGLKWLRNGFVSKDSVGPLGFGHTLRTDYEAFFHFQNLMLLGQAMGLGGWIHGSVFPPYIYTRDEAKGHYGLGFRMQEAKQRSPMAPVPASQPNPVGIDGVLEGLCPPYVTMDEAVDRVIEAKYSRGGGGYGDADIFSSVYRQKKDGDAYLRSATKFSPMAIEYVKEVCNYIQDTYGRFPAHVDAFYTPGMWLQFHHLELEYYDRYFKPEQYARQAEHDALWHGI
jgi:hypothetical protein